MDTNRHEVAKRRRRRNWSDCEKRMICAQTRFPGISISQVARLCDVNANQVFNWLKDPLFAKSLEVADVAMFLPVKGVDTVLAGHVASEDIGEIQPDFHREVQRFKRNAI
ncbi:MAG: transposase [Pseudomonadota bacterium]